jgi:hypothetical protein
MGMIELRRDDRDIYFIYPRSRFEADLAGYLGMLKADFRA